MDSLRGNYGSLAESGYDPADDEDEEGEDEVLDDDGLPVPSFGLDDDDDEPVSGPSFGSLLKMPIQPAKTPIELSEDYVPEEDEFAAPGFDEPMELTEEVFDEPAEAADEAFAQPVELEPASFAEPAEPAFAEPEPAVHVFAAPVEAAVHEIELPEIDPSEMELGDWLAAAREMAVAARGNEERTREALYEAIGRAYDFSLAAAEAPAEFEEIVADSGLTAQDRAPMTPVVKLVFGADYDKTRLTEYAAALTHAHRLELPRGTLGEFLREAEGGLKGVVKAERRLRKEEAGKEVEPVDAPRHALAKKLRAMAPQAFDTIDSEGSEFALVMIRRTEDGDVVMLGEVPEDVALVERAARRLLG